MSLGVIVLAAGEGTRMKSSRPKVLHAICGKPMIHFVLESIGTLHPEEIVVVIGHKADEVRQAIDGVEFAFQEEQLGTGHAVLTAEDLFAAFDGTIAVISGDTPLVKAKTFSDLVSIHESSGAAASILTARVKDPTGYGRIIRDSDGVVAAIVEEKDATVEQRKIDEVNSGIYCFDKKKLFEALRQVDSNNEQREYYLTDVIKILTNRGEKIMASIADEPDEIMGVNSRIQLAGADKVMRRTINERFMLNGVTIIDPDMTFISPDATIGRDTVIYPMTFIDGKTSIGEGCIIGPSSRLIDCAIGNGVIIENSVVRESTIEDGASLGPFCHIRPGTLVRAGAKVGGFVEVKNSDIGAGSKVPHLSYIGDAQIGDYVNIGAGTITCNYDGTNKYRTIIEDGAFIGSDTMLVAPVRIGEGAFTGAGSVISKDVPADSLAIERTEQKVIDNWAKRRHKKKDI
ncbi:MAG TPA: bifunctional UDP-N-acetylglucosamine diphosphorylase/glucosamine-1-phosphate N-acetyltransferase GlmU [Anaerolineae bacterium]|nr:bifunctional UDP-N-acetylglucosamine diphosphorylase/glucosamine-1-phosphate N-acetyltransferase GlmU [Anaerolineae bacterium]